MEHPNIYLVLYWIVPLLFLMVFGVIFLAAIGKSIGIRYVYMNILLFVFEVCGSSFKLFLRLPRAHNYLKT